MQRSANLSVSIGALFDPNGAGKSTLLGAKMGISRYSVTTGKIYFKDEA